jgi:hypothetical protein
MGCDGIGGGGTGGSPYGVGWCGARRGGCGEGGGVCKCIGNRPIVCVAGFVSSLNVSRVLLKSIFKVRFFDHPRVAQKR